MFSIEEKTTLIRIATHAIEYGLVHREAPTLDTSGYSTGLQARRASFVTLKCKDALRGCIGSLEAVRALVVDVSNNAYAAAFRDARFAPLAGEELESLDISVSVLSAPEPLQFTSLTNAIEQLRPGIDGLILEEGTRYRGTFLPAVWESLPEPAHFLRHLRVKAGLPADYWSDTLRLYRYSAEIIKA